MSLKEFDYKQFLLEKGEQVGLGVAVTLMVLMLIFNLFMPGSGFFSGSPNTKARELNEGTGKLEDALATRQPSESDLPEKRGEGKLIAIDTESLIPDNYETAKLFEPRIRENPSRRPPKIYNVDEAVAEVAYVPIDTYLFDGKDRSKIWILVDKEGRRPSSGGGSGGFNPFANLGKGGSGGMGAGSGGMGGMMQQQQMQQQMQQRQMQMQQQSQMQSRMQFGNPLNAARQLAGASEEEYKLQSIPTDTWSDSMLTARQLRPLRMAIIAGSFPYKAQLEEHKRKLRLPSVDAVLNEDVDEVGDSKKKAKAFRFIMVEVQRKEVDVDGKPLGDWLELDLAGHYQVWLEQTHVPFQPEDPKLTEVRFPGLAMPLLREFHPNKANAPGIPGMQAMMRAGGMQPSKTGAEEESVEEDNTQKAMKSVLEKLPKLKDTLGKLNNVKPQQIARPKFRAPTLPNPFSSEVVFTGDDKAAPAPDPNKQGADAGQEYIPEYALVRVVDVFQIQPGKHYRYRMRIRMANPNYKRKDVASPAYKDPEYLVSDNWVEVPQTVSVPPETHYYVVDEKQGLKRNDIAQMPRDSAQYRMYVNTRPLTEDQVIFQFHRWVDTTQRSRKDPDQVPVGEWVVADRVPVARGEYIGRKVNVDVPIWIYARNAFILPHEDKSVKRGRVNTGIDVDFGEENPENNLILVDFEGGRIKIPGAKTDDNCPTEVLMLAPDGKLLARNSLKDNNDDERQKRREQVLKRIQEVRVGKKD